MAEHFNSLVLLHNWVLHAEKCWYQISDTQGCYGSGYNSWGVQTNQKFLSAMAVLGVLGSKVDEMPKTTCDQAREWALAALRFSLASHVSGNGTCTDGTQWGHTWISGLGIERMMHGVYLLDPYLKDQDREDLRRVLSSEADWLCFKHHRGQHTGVCADPWDTSGRNWPESNIWTGALLWRAGVTYPDHRNSDAWKEQAHRFLINGVSVAADKDNETVIGGKPVKEWHIGANFHSGYALDHHGYLNVGYMVICLSNAAMLHFDLLSQNLEVPESVYHHQADLWRTVKKMIFANGRLARIGGDSRVRYTYCQEYLLPSLVFAAHHLKDEYAADLLDAQLNLIKYEAERNEDGSFYGNRLAKLIRTSPYYYTRLESDRACCLGMSAAYQKFLGPSEPTEKDFESAVAGGWSDADHGAVLHRDPDRFASFTWRGHGGAQGLCLPPGNGHLTEWQQNLAGFVRFQNDNPVENIGHKRERVLEDCRITGFEGGFITSGCISEGNNTVIHEGWRGNEQARHQLVVAALPDGHTMVGLQYCRTGALRAYVSEIKGLHLNIANDLYNNFERQLVTAGGRMTLHSPAAEDLEQPLDCHWVLIEDQLGAVGLYGADSITLCRSSERKGGRLGTLYTETFCWPLQTGTRPVPPHTVVLDAGWAVTSAVNEDQVVTLAQSCRTAGEPGDSLPFRGVRVQAPDGNEYAVIANFDTDVRACPVVRPLNTGERFTDLVTGDEYDGGRRFIVSLDPGQGRVFKVDK